MRNTSGFPSHFSNLRVSPAILMGVAGVFVAVLTAKPHGSERTASNPRNISQFAERPSVFGPLDNRHWFWQNPLPQGNDLRGASFIDASTATLVGVDGTIVRTTDAGSSWTIQTSGTTEI